MSELAKVRVVAERTGLARSTIYALAARHAIPHIRFGKRAIRFPLDELENWIEGQICQPAETSAEG